MDEVTGSLDGQLPLHSVGERLRMAREQKGMTLEQLAAETRIPRRHLELIEQGEFAALPARTYATGFARTYAKAVGLDDRAVVADVRSELAANDGGERGRVATFEPGDPARVPTRGLTLASLAALVLLLVGGYMFYDRVLAPGETPASLLDGQAPAQRAAATPAVPAPAAPGGPVVFTALEDGVWAKFYDAAGTQLFQKEMAKGESFTVPAEAQGPMVWTGRPDALAITVGGQPIAKLSDTQKIVKDVPVTATALLGRGEPATAENPVQVAATGSSPAVAAPANDTATKAAAIPAPQPSTRAAARPAPRRTAAPQPRASAQPVPQATVSRPVVQPIGGSAAEGEPNTSQQP